MRNNELSSTEKLLNLIKGQDQQDSVFSETRNSRLAKQPRPDKKPLLSRISPLGEEIVVGVDIGPTDVKLVKIAHYSEYNIQLLAARTVALDSAMSRNSQEFHGFLRKTLNDFCAPTRKFKIWTTISSLNVEIRLLSFPVVPKNLMTNAVRLTLQKEVPFDEKEMMFDYEYQGAITEGEVNKLSVLAFIAPKKEIREIRELFGKIGYPLAGVTVISFALQNLHRAGSGRSENVPECHLFIGSDWSRIDLYDRGALTLIRDVKTGKNSMIEDIMEGVNRQLRDRELPESSEEKAGIPPANGNDPALSGSGLSDYGAEEPLSGTEPESADGMFVLDLEGTREEPEREMQTTEEISLREAKSILESQLENNSPDQKKTGYSLSSGEIFTFIRPSIDRLLRQIERTISHYTTSFQGRSPGRLYFTGSLGTYRRLVEYTGEQLGIHAAALDPFEYISHNRTKIPSSLGERIDYAPAVGLGLSKAGRTPNFLYTQEDREHIDRLARKDRIIFGCFLAAIFVSLAAYIWQNQVISAKQGELDSLKRELRQYSPEVSEPFLRRMAVEITRKQASWQTYQKKYRGLGLIGELVSLTPPDTTYQECAIIPGQKRAGKNTAQQMVLKGRIRGNIEMLEPQMAHFLVKLANSSLFDQPRIEKSVVRSKTDGNKKKGEETGTLSYTVRLNIL